MLFPPQSLALWNLGPETMGVVPKLCVTKTDFTEDNFSTDQEEGVVVVLAQFTRVTFILYFLIFNYLFWAVLGLCSFAQDFFSCSEQGLLLVMLLGRLTVVTSLLAERGLSTRGLSHCGAPARSLRSTWDLPGPGFEPKSPALAGGDSYPLHHWGSPTLYTFYF